MHLHTIKIWNSYYNLNTQKLLQIKKKTKHINTYNTLTKLKKIASNKHLHKKINTKILRLQKSNNLN